MFYRTNCSSTSLFFIHFPLSFGSKLDKRFLLRQFVQVQELKSFFVYLKYCTADSNIFMSYLPGTFLYNP